MKTKINLFNQVQSIINIFDEISKEEYCKLEIDEEMKDILNNIIKRIDSIEETR